MDPVEDAIAAGPAIQGVAILELARVELLVAAAALQEALFVDLFGIVARRRLSLRLRLGLAPSRGLRLYHVRILLLRGRRIVLASIPKLARPCGQEDTRRIFGRICLTVPLE